jgi:adenylate kinase family enzyme
MDRVLLVGTTGSGKTTLARAIADACDIPYVEMDRLFWKPNWTESDPDEFRARVDAATAGPRWVADADYLPRIGNLLWERVDTVIWLDLPTSLITVRLARRTVSRSLRRTDLWAGNHESLTNLWKRETLPVWVVRIQHANRAEYQHRMSDAAWSHVRFVRLRSMRTVRSWVSELPSTT